MNKKAKILGVGSFLPSKVLTNQDLEKIVETSDEWIQTRTGIEQRRIANENEHTSYMGAQAALQALANAKMSAQEIDFIIVATITPDFIFPSTACLIQTEIGATKAAAMDIQAACTGFLYALSMAKSFVESGAYKNVLVIASEKLSTITNYQDRTTCILFGDGAGACVVSASGEGLILDCVCLGADGSQSSLLMMPAGGCRMPASNESVAKGLHFISMAGNEVFKHAVRRMESSCKECLMQAQIAESEVTYLIPHQANLRIIDAIAKRFTHLSSDRIYKTVQKYGNTSASSVAIALDELCKEKKIGPKDNILLTAFGGGFTWGSALLKGSV